MGKFSSIISNSSWHEGEVAIQRRAGVADQMAPVARYVNINHLIEQHRKFFPQLPFIAAGAIDPEGDVWATILCGEPGFLRSPDPATLRINAALATSDPARPGFAHGCAVGLLGIELDTRRRNRLNGTVSRVDEAVFDVVVEQSYGNCPQYIQLRDFTFARDPAEDAPAPPLILGILNHQAAAMIEKANTFFIASYVILEDGRRQVDVSHKGGRPGFVHIGKNDVLTIPDFAGNLYFNTLGNIYLNPKCGLVFIDFESGDMLQITGEAEVILDAPEIAAFQGAERLLRVTPSRIIFRAGALPLRWVSQPQGAAPNALMTGTWPEAAARLQALEIKSAWRTFEVSRIVEESSVIRSLYIQPADRAGLLLHQAGQHLPVRVQLPGEASPAQRHYTLTSAPSDGAYRVSIKRDGAVSTFLHTLQTGDRFDVRAPAGAFTIDAHSTKFAVFLGAGIGVTPLLAMLRHIVYEGIRTRRIRPSWFVYCSHSKADVADACIHTEAFGAASVKRRPDAGKPSMAMPQPAMNPVGVTFSVSGKYAQWTPGSGSLLELAEAEGIFPPCSCRAGACGTCHARVLSGVVSYAITPGASIAEGDALICCAVPAISTEGGLGLCLEL